MEARSPRRGGSETTAPLPEDSAYRLQPGDPVGEYEVLRKLDHAGGWGQVYEARPLEEGGGHRRVAIKTIRPEYGGNPEYRERFRKEQQGLRGLKHPNLCCPFDWNKSTNDLLWLAMPWVYGEDLFEVVVEPLKPHRAAALIAQAADGLHALHVKAEKAHCDVHPGNLMVDANGRAVVIDFGLAKRFDHPSGSPPRALQGRWVSPEGRVGAEMTPQSDVYSLGLVLAFALSGLEPEGGRPRFAPGQTVPEELRAIIDGATAPHPEARQRSAAKVAVELRKFLGPKAPAPLAAPGTPVTAAAPGRPRRALPIAPVLAAAAAIAAAAFFVTLSLASSSTETPSRVQVKSPGLTLTAPAGWRTASVTAVDRKLGMRAAVSGTDATVLTGSIEHGELPTDAEGRAAVDVALPAGDALRVDDVGHFDAQRMFVFHTSHGYPTIVCRGAYGAVRQAVDAACANLATAATLADPALPIPYPVKAVRRQAATALQGYAKARRTAATAIEDATTRPEVEAAARGIASTARKLAKSVSTPSLAALRRALAGAAKSWQAAANAAAHGEGFHQAGKKVMKAEEAIRRAYGELVELGYAKPETAGQGA